MTRARNPITSKNEAEARANYEADGLCYTCGMRQTGCLHVLVSHMMSPDEYKRRGVDEMNFDQLRDLRLEILNALPTETRGRDEVIRISTDRLDTTWTARTMKGA